MSRKFQIAALLLLQTFTLGVTVEQDGGSRERNVNNSGGANLMPPDNKDIKRTASQDLRTFFNTDIKPLSFSHFNRPPSVKEAQEEDLAVTTPTNTKTLIGGGIPPSMALTMTDNILQGIRDLRLTLAEMDEKLDRVVQKVVPVGGNPGVMKKGAQIFKRLFRIPSSAPEPGSGVGQQRGLAYLGAGRPESGVGLRF